jgi:hypothetical protein
LKELARSYLTITKDLTRVMNRLKALYRSWGIPCAGNETNGAVTTVKWNHREEEGSHRFV